MKLSVSSDKFRGKLGEMETTLGEWFLEREAVVHGILHALLTRNHVLIMGKHGTAKSMLTNSIFSAFQDAKVFNIQMTKFMTEDAVFGIADIRKMQQEGVIEYRTEGMLPQADFAYLDEMLDANDAVLRSLLDILNERMFRRGRQVEECPLHTAVATTNFYEETPQLEAVLDRFLIKMRVDPLDSDESVCAMLMNSQKQSGEPIPVPEISKAELMLARSAIRKVKIPLEVVELYIELVTEYVKESGGKMFISDRRKVWNLELIKAAAWLEDRAEAQAGDLEQVRFGLAMINNDTQEDWFAKAFTAKVASIDSRRDAENDLDLFKRAVNKLRAGVSNISTMRVDEASEIAKGLRKVINTLASRDKETSVQFPEIQEQFNVLEADAKTLMLSITDSLKSMIKEENSSDNK